ncbi:FadR/GntR family transcriptional regulator [Sinomonas sp. G460-2]|uniref:FadR/GntR family transcriptional regulator n=1 Tax=Sinomonas sp. G460-2 TaxID=3393464 RepID=UPI0039EFD9CC
MTNALEAAPAASRRHAEVLDAVGAAICSGELAPQSALLSDELEARFDVSRTLVREVLRVLSSLGLIASRRRTGTVVLPESEWDAFSPQVIRWKLASPHRVAQLQELTELRRAVEPLAAQLAAERAGNEARAEIVRLSAAMWAAGTTERTDEFVELDIAFHHAILASSGNGMFGKLNRVTEEVLAGRVHHGLMPPHLDRTALQGHLEVATAIQRGDGQGARAAMERLVVRSVDEMSHLWADPAPAIPAQPRRNMPEVR